MNEYMIKTEIAYEFNNIFRGVHEKWKLNGFEWDNPKQKQKFGVEGWHNAKYRQATVYWDTKVGAVSNVTLVPNV